MIRQASRWLVVLLLCLPGPAGAEDLDKKLLAYENEARVIGRDLPQPNQLTGVEGQRRLVEAQVVFSLGDYPKAALMLFELASKPGPEQETALYYLAESLFHKGDKGSSRTYFEQVVASNNQASKYYQPSLGRLVEIAIHQQDTAAAEASIAKLEAAHGPALPYVKGKYAFSVGKFDDAIASFGQVPAGSEHELQALYYAATSQVAKKDLDRATQMFTDLTSRKPKTNRERRVVELSQLALGRLYYERAQPSKSIDSYLNVDRRSDLFADALYEVAWVYVKGRQFDKALRALQLLNLSNPESKKAPTFRILEGNLHIRKAQMIREAQIAGTIDASLQKASPEAEYDEAAAIFTQTHDEYMPSYAALEQMIAANTDPAEHLAQLAGRSSSAFQTSGPLPDAAVEHLRDEPDVQRAVAIQVDLNEIENNIKDSEAIIARFEAVLATGDRNGVYPALSSRRRRIGIIQDDLIKIRSELADQQLRLVASSGELSQATATRKQLFQQYTAMPNAEQAYAERVAGAQAEYDKLEERAGEVRGALDSTLAMSTALRKHSQEAQPPLTAEQKSTITTTLDETAREGQALEGELADVNREIMLGRDLAGIGDDSIAKARDARKALHAALVAEHRLLVSASGGSRDGSKSRDWSALGERAGLLYDTLAQTDSQIESAIERAMEQVKTVVVTERANLVTYRAELSEYEVEARAVGGTVLAASFKDVKAKFYDVIIRADVGNVDVGWSQKEDADDDLKRLNLSRTRELRQLKDEFRQVLDESTTKPSAPRDTGSSLPAADPNAPGGSPDRATGGDTRVKPGGGKTEPVQPTVKPDPTGPQPKKGTQPKKKVSP